MSRYVADVLHIQILDEETKDVAAEVKRFDEGASEVEIKTLTNPSDWFDLSKAIGRALKVIHPNG